MADLNYYFGPWQRDAEQNAWVPPSGTVGLLDFGSLNDCAISPSAIDQRGIGLFCTPRGTTLPSEYDHLDSGDCREIQVTTAHRDLVEAVLGVRIDAIGMTLAQACAELFATGDPTGLERWKPLTPTREGVYEIHLGGHSTIFKREFLGPADPWWNKQRDQLRYDLGQHDKDCKAEAKALKDAAKELRKQKKDKESDACDTRAAKVEFHAEKVLDAMCRKYRCLPSELSQTIRRGKAETTISDNFSASLTGWTAASGSWATADVGGGNYRLRETASDGHTQRVIRNDTVLSSTDHYAQAELYSNARSSMYHGVAIRFSNSAATCYSTSANSGYLTINKIVAGSNTVITGYSTWINPWASGQTRKLNGSGATLTATHNAIHTINATDSALSDYRVGIGHVYKYPTSTEETDNFYATDGIVPGNPYYAYAQQQ